MAQEAAFNARQENWRSHCVCIFNTERLSLYSRKRAKNRGQNNCSSGKFSEKSPKIWFHG
jgi:hypothetical protein